MLGVVGAAVFTPAVADAAGDLLNKQNAGSKATSPLTGLLGGMPAGGLSTSGLLANGLPLGH